MRDNLFPRGGNSIFLRLILVSAICPGFGEDGVNFLPSSSYGVAFQNCNQKSDDNPGMF